MSYHPRLGAYVLAADPTWLRSSVLRYYDRLEVFVVSASASGHGWTGHPIASHDCVELCRSIDTRGVMRVVSGEWTDDDPMRAETAQRQAALDAFPDSIDWILQLDSDEVLPSVDALLRVLELADEQGVDAVEWPMRVLYRRLRNGRYLQVATPAGTSSYEYPGPVAVRPGVRLQDARRTDAPFLRPTVRGDDASPQLRAVAAPEEIRSASVAAEDAIVHNSWARSTDAVRRKVASWGHNQGLRSRLYFWAIWWPAPLRWRRMRDFHPLFAHLWPRLALCADDPSALLIPAER